MPISLNPMHYIALGAIILIGGLLGYSQVLKTRLSLCTSASEAVIAKTNAAAQQQIALNAQESVKRDTITRNLEETNVKLQSDLARQYADARRLHNSATGSSRVPPLPFPSESRACGQDETNIARSMDEIAGRVLDILEQGDRAIAAAKIREDWEDQQESLQKLNEK